MFGNGVSLTAVIAIALSAFGAVLAVLASFGTLRKTRGWRTTAFWLVPAAAVWPSFALIAASIVPPLRAALESDGVRTVVFFAPVLMLSVVLVARAGLTSRRLGASAAVLSAMVAVATLSAALIGQSWAQGAAALLVLLGCGAAGRTVLPQLSDGILVSVVSLCALLGAYGLLLPQVAVRTDCQDNYSKCELLGGFVSVGQGSGSNAFAITLAMLGAFAVVRMRAWPAAALTVAIGASALASGARLAAACAVAGGCIALIAKMPRRGGVCALVFAIGSALGSLAFAVIPFVPSAFTDRGTLWMRARRLVAESPLFGHGLSFWVRDATTQPRPSGSYSPHNMWLDIAVAGGVAAVVCVAGALALGLYLVRGEARTAALTFAAVIFIVGCVESTFMPFRLNPVPAGMIALVAYLSAAQDRDRLRRLLSLRARVRSASPAEPPQG